jgi:dTDP-4-dehydrorhamnose reductase
MKILITGAKGMLGRALQDELTKTEYNYIAVDKDECDITNINEVNNLLQLEQPTHLINCAAYTAVDKAEEDRENSYQINADGPKNLAIACKEYQCQLIHISTDYVFDGTSLKAYREDDKTNPLSVYGASKLLGEEHLLKHYPEAKVVRTQWLYGPYGNHFVNTMLNLARKYQSLTVVDDQIGTPTFTRHLAQSLRVLLHHSAGGIFHLRNSGHCSWYNFAVEIFSQSNNDITVTPVDSSAYPRPAARPKHSVLGMNRWLDELKEEPLPHWKQGLADFLQES